MGDCIISIVGLSLAGDVLLLPSTGDPLFDRLMLILRSVNCDNPNADRPRSLFLPGDDGTVCSGDPWPWLNISNLELERFVDRDGVRGGVVGECCAVNESSVSSPSSRSHSGDTARIVMMSR